VCQGRLAVQNSSSPDKLRPCGNTQPCSQRLPADAIGADLVRCGS
jgi:hypothetical protein